MKVLKAFSNTLEKMTLKELRESQNLSQIDFAKTLGVTRSTYACWESGRNGLPEEMKKKIAETFNCEIEENSKQIVLTGELEQPLITKKQDEYGHTCCELCVSTDELENSLRNDFSNFTKTFFNIGFKLTLINNHFVYKQRGFETFEDYAKDVFNIGKSSMYAYMKVYELTHDYSNPDMMKKDFCNYNYSQLEAMTTAKDGNLQWRITEKLPPSTDRDDIRKFIKAYDDCAKNGGTPLSWKGMDDALDYLENKKPKTDSVPEQAPGQRYINDDSSIDDYNIEPEENQEHEVNYSFFGLDNLSYEEFSKINKIQEKIKDFLKKNRYEIFDSCHCSISYIAVSSVLAKELFKNKEIEL